MTPIAPPARRRKHSRRVVLGAAVAVAAAVSVEAARSCAAAEGPVPPAAQAPAPQPARDQTPATPGLPAPAGMVRHPGGTVKVGIDEKPLREWVKGTAIGRMEKSFLEEAWSRDLSTCTSEHEVVLRPFWIGQYETTNAQYHRFLHDAGRVEYVVPAKEQSGARTLVEISRVHLLCPPFTARDGSTEFPVAVEWKTLYDLNAALLDPDGSVGPGAFKDRQLPPGMRLVTFRHTVPETWVDPKTGGRRAEFPAGQDDFPVTGVSLLDATACAAYYGNHIPTEYQWEAAARGPKGSYFPEGEKFDPLAHAWKDFNLELSRAQEAAKKRLPNARDAAETERLTALLARRPLRADALSVPVGLFPEGASPIGAHDMLGNVDEWTSNTLFKYPGSISDSYFFTMDACTLRGGNLLDKDTLLHVALRKFQGPSGSISPHFRFTSSGFRMAREEIPGLSLAAAALRHALTAEPRVVPGEMDPKTFVATFVGLDPAQATGIEQVHEVAPGIEPMGRVYHLGRARGMCFIPADRTPFTDNGRLGKAAEAAALPVPGPDGKTPADRRQPHEIPFLGLLHLTPEFGIKGLRKVVTIKMEPIPGAKPIPREPDEEEAPPATDEPPTEGGEKPPEGGDKPAGGGDKPAGGGEKPAGDGKKPPGGAGKKPEGGAGKKPEGGAGKKPEGGEPPPAGDPPPEEPKPPEMIIPMRQVEVIGYEPGTLEGARFPHGLLVGYGKFEGERRIALWEARASTLGGSAPGGIVLLERPDLVLAPTAVKFDKVSSPRSAESRIDKVSGELTLYFFLAMEGKGQKGGWMVTLTLPLDFEPGDRPWVTTPRPMVPR